MPESPFDSFAQNGEDMVLWRYLSHVDGGRYIEVRSARGSEQFGFAGLLRSRLAGYHH